MTRLASRALTSLPAASVKCFLSFFKDWPTSRLRTVCESRRAQLKQLYSSFSTRLECAPEASSSGSLLSNTRTSFPSLCSGVVATKNRKAEAADCWEALLKNP